MNNKVTSLKIGFKKFAMTNQFDIRYLCLRRYSQKRTSSDSVQRETKQEKIRIKEKGKQFRKTRLELA